MISKVLIELCVATRTAMAWIHSLIPAKKVRDILQFLICFPIYYFWISIDRFCFPVGKRFNPFIEFPRNTIEVTQRGEVLFDLIKGYHNKPGAQRDYSKVSTPPSAGSQSFSPLPPPVLIPQTAKFVSLVRSAETDECIKEDKKKIQVSFYTLTYTLSSTGATVSVDIFVKTPGQRTIARSIEALISSFGARGSEQRFYQDIFPNTDPVLTNVPHGIASFGSRLFSHACIVSNKVDTTRWKSITDAQGMSLPQAQALVKASARVHAQFWNPPIEPKNATQTEYFNDRQGLSWLSFTTHFFSDKEADFAVCPPWMPSLWATLTHFFAPSLTAVSHGDCRPGNMLFSDTASPDSQQAADRNVIPGGEKVPSTDLIMTDWEGCSIAPASWDITYSLGCGLPPHERRQHQRYLFDLHFATLVDTLKNSVPNQKTAAAALAGSIPTTTGNGNQAKFLEVHSEHYPMKTMKDRLELELDVMPIIINYFGWLLAHTGNAGETQGNLEGDGQSWPNRMRSQTLDPFLCNGDMVSACNDGYDSWTAPQLPNGCRCQDKTTMEELGIISAAQGNLLPGPADPSEPASRANRTKVGSDGAILGAVDPDYSKMHLSGRLLHFLQPYHDLGRRIESETMGPSVAKKNPKKFNRTLREDLLDMLSSASKMGLDTTTQDAIDRKVGSAEANKKAVQLQEATLVAQKRVRKKD